MPISEANSPKSSPTDQRVLLGPDDVTDFAGQVRELVGAGVTAPMSFECLSTTLAQDHTLHDDLAEAMHLIGDDAREAPEARDSAQT